MTTPPQRIFNKAFVERFTDKYPQRVVSDPMEDAYVGVQLWAQAVREAQSIEPKKIRRAMLNQRLAAPDGDSPPPRGPATSAAPPHC